MSASAAILRISEKPPACIRSGWTMRQPPFSRSSRYSKRDSRRSPVAIGVLISRCSAAIAFAFSNGIGSSNQPGRNGCSASSIITAVRGDRNSLHSMKMSASGPAPSRARFHQRRGFADFPGGVVAQALERERATLERGEAAAHRFLRAGERLLGRVGALQPVACVAAELRTERSAEKPSHRHAEPLAFEVPQRDVERGQRCLQHRAAAPAPRVIQAVPMALGSRRVLADQVRRVLADCRLDRLQRAVERAFAPAGDPFVGVDADEQPVHPVDPEFERFNPGDLHRGAVPWLFLGPYAPAGRQAPLKPFTIFDDTMVPPRTQACRGVQGR